LPGGHFEEVAGEENLYLLLSTKKEPKSLPPDTISGLKMYPKFFRGPTVGAHSAAPDPLVGLRAASLQGREGNGKGGREGERRKGGRGK